MIAQADLETFLGISSGTDTALLTELEAAAVAWVERQTSRYFGASGSVTEYVVGNGSVNLYLANIPSSVTSVVSQGYQGDDTTTIATGDDDGWVLRDQHLVRKGGYKWDTALEYVVTYVRGYTQSDAGPPADIAAPYDIRLAVQQIVKALYGGEGVGGVGSAIRSEKIGDYSYTLGGSSDGILFDAIPTLKETINHWRQVHI